MVCQGLWLFSGPRENRAVADQLVYKVHPPPPPQLKTRSGGI